MMDVPIVFVGGGRMGGAILRGLAASGPVEAFVVDPNVAQAPGATLMRDLDALPDLGEAVVLLAVKPQVAGDLLPRLKRFARPGVLLISIVAGLSIEILRDALGDELRAVRAMPNTPAGVLKGITGVYAAANIDANGRARAEALLSAVGEVVWLDTEEGIDLVTAISGSGPAYFFRFAEALAAAGVGLGLPPDTAQRLARRTLEGAGALADSTDRTLEELRVEVTSPKGTTAAALQRFSEGGLEALVAAAAKASQARARELGEEIASKLTQAR
ncbi:MAG TPA: pyrroline-5-carboxylate reductase [Caulobacteraceae bacterium]|jgi:pyrroline-5-carboxylate reductase